MMLTGRVTQWAHSPSHLFEPGSAYIATAGTYGKKHILNSPERKTLVLSALFEQAQAFGWLLEAWAVLSNHYHFVAHAPDDADTLKRMIQALHSTTARVLNAEDNAPGRTVWFQYRDTCLTNQKSYLARLHYVHTNPAKHGVVAAAENYPWCSMSWFQREAKPAFCRTVLSFKCDRVSVYDDF
ncbi:MAG TPA: transposase [Candidatus Hydrogenedentes bacterium]|nr:transposase [Candidatus Hydrogenedentota bacterium]HPG65505.1 transposase [Candidatus Hydrogenedentota bacterium]